MFDRLQKKWKVSGLQLTLILCTFAIGGSLTGYTGRLLMSLLPVERGWLWVVIYIIAVTVLWPLAVILISIPFGQFRFFTRYLKKMGKRIGLSRESGINSQQSGVRSQESGINAAFSQLKTCLPVGKAQKSKLTTKLAIFASGAGSNAYEIISYFGSSLTACDDTISKDNIKVGLVVSNKPAAGVIKIAEKEKIPTLILEKEKFFRGNGYVDELREQDIDLIILAGFLWKIPSSLINAYPGKIINIHPALLPKYGGKGMYGQRVHQTVIDNNEKESGITIHYVDEVYDNGDIIFQATCPVLENDTADSLAQRIHQLEHKHYPEVIKKIIDKLTG